MLLKFAQLYNDDRFMAQRCDVFVIQRLTANVFHLCY